MTDQELLSESEMPMLVPHLRSKMAERYPNRVAIQAVAWSDGKKAAQIKNEDWRSITWPELIKLTDATAFLLGEGRFESWPVRTANDSVDMAPPKIAALVSTDIASVLSLEGLMKRGVQSFLISPRNSIPVLAEMLTIDDIHYLAYSRANKDVAHAVQKHMAEHSQRSLTIAELPNIAEIDERAAQSSSSYPYDFDVQAEFTKPVIALHTSGSSGSRPKICPYTHQMLVTHTFALQWPGFQDITVCTTVPLFHAFGLFVGLGYAAVNRSTITAAPAGATFLGEELITFLKSAKTNFAVLVPQQIESVASTAGGLDFLKSMGAVLYGGAALRPDTKQHLVDAGVNFLCGFGTTETMANAFAQVHKWPNGVELDREWMRLLDHIGYRFEFFSAATDDTPELSELIILDGKAPLPRHTIEGGFETGDLVIRHPEYPEWIKIWGRKSNMIVLSNGENAPVQPVEDPVCAHPWVSTAILFGVARPQVGLLVELKPEHTIKDLSDSKAVEAARNELWPTIQKVNEDLPDFAKLFKNMIIFADASKGELPRTDKGTPKRQLILNMFTKQIDALYDSVGSGADSVVQITSIEQDELLTAIYQILGAIYGEEKELGPDTSLTLELGQDSLRATHTRTAIVSSLKAAAKEGRIPELASFDTSLIPAQITYDNSTPATLAAALHDIIEGTKSDTKPDSQIKLMKELIEKYTQRLSDPSSKTKQRRTSILGGLFKRSNTVTKKHTVFLTGSTGAFGTQILEQLLARPEVEKVICLIRSKEDGTAALERRQVEAFTSKKLDPAPASSPKVEYLRGSPSQQGLEVPPGVTAIVHAAWSVHFNLSLIDFIPEIEGAVHLLEEARRLGARFVFASSVATLMAATPAPEEALTSDGQHAIDEEYDLPLEWANLGYGRSKAVVEKVVQHAVHKEGIEAITIRCGQILGDARTGSWNAHEWAPRMFRSAEALGSLPDDLGLADWITVNDGMQVFVDAALKSDVPARTPASKTNVINLSNPNRVPWSNVLNSFRPHLPASVKVVPTLEWLQHLDEAAHKGANSSKAEYDALVKKIPALELLDTYKGMASAAAPNVLSIRNAVTLTDGKLENADVMNQTLAGRCLSFWKG
ncbi:hypothetical protein OC861_004072 [Tilletia horrida]|nr:hypothetical protein OC861_004072 [Tilletia horrida]